MTISLFLFKTRTSGLFAFILLHSFSVNQEISLDLTRSLIVVEPRLRQIYLSSRTGMEYNPSCIVCSDIGFLLWIICFINLLCIVIELVIGHIKRILL